MIDHVYIFICQPALKFTIWNINLCVQLKNRASNLIMIIYIYIYIYVSCHPLKVQMVYSVFTISQTIGGALHLEQNFVIFILNSSNIYIKKQKKTFINKSKETTYLNKVTQ